MKMMGIVQSVSHSYAADNKTGCPSQMWIINLTLKNQDKKKKIGIDEVNHFTEYCELIFENIVSGGVFNTTPFLAYWFVCHECKHKA